MEASTKQKIAAFGLITLGSLEMPLLDQYVDKKAIQDWLAVNGQNCPSEDYYPLYKRWGVMVPLVTGIAGLVAGAVGSMKIDGKTLLKPEYSLAAIEYGTAATMTAVGKVIQVAQTRVNNGLPAFNVKCNTVAAQQQQAMPQPTGYVCPPAGCSSGSYRQMSWA